jgi:Rrf2 family transcriptional regulator, cysteine metabolism repressor
MKLTVKSEYACLAMIALAEQFDSGEVITIARISEQKSIPKKYLEQILLALKRGGYVRSRKGPEGGYGLAKKPEEINVAEIVRLMDGALAPVESVSKYFFEHTPIEKCPKLLNVFKTIRDYISETLEGITFKELTE